MKNHERLDELESKLSKYKTSERMFDIASDLADIDQEIKDQEPKTKGNV